MTQKFTDLFLKGLKPKDKEYTAREKGGFGIRVMPSGRKGFFYLYRVDGQRRFLNLGEYPDIDLKEARKKYEAAAAQVKLLKDGLPGGADPVQVKEDKREEREIHRKAPTVSELCADYIERHAKRKKRSWRKDEQILNRDVVPAWGKRKAKDITKSDVIRLSEKIIDRGAPIMANYVYQVCRKMFNWAVEQDILQATPFLGTKLPSITNARERVLSEAEIKTLWGRLDQTDLNMSAGIRRCLKLILLTGQRPNEVSGMHAREIDGHWWTLPVERQKVAKAKEGKRGPHRVYLTDMALELIGDTTGKGYVFPTPFKDVEQPLGDTALAVAVGRNLAYPLTDKNGTPLYNKDGTPATENRLGVGHFTPHDLRRTCATFMAKNGEMDEVIDAVLCHAKKGIIGTYNQYRYDAEKQKALTVWSDKIKIILAGDKVISMKRKTA